MAAGGVGSATVNDDEAFTLRALDELVSSLARLEVDAAADAQHTASLGPAAGAHLPQSANVLDAVVGAVLTQLGANGLVFWKAPAESEDGRCGTDLDATIERLEALNDQLAQQQTAHTLSGSTSPPRSSALSLAQRSPSRRRAQLARPRLRERQRLDEPPESFLLAGSHSRMPSLFPRPAAAGHHSPRKQAARDPTAHADEHLGIELAPTRAAPSLVAQLAVERDRRRRIAERAAAEHRRLRVQCEALQAGNEALRQLLLERAQPPRPRAASLNCSRSASPPSPHSARGRADVNGATQNVQMTRRGSLGASSVKVAATQTTSLSRSHRRPVARPRSAVPSAGSQWPRGGKQRAHWRY